MSILLAADIGGTKTRLRLSQLKAGVLSTLKQTQYNSGQWHSFDAVLDDFLQTHSKNNKPCHSACFAVAGPVRNSQDTRSSSLANVTNLPWKLCSQTLKQRFKLPLLSLINDFQAIGHCVDVLDKKDFFTLQAGKTALDGALNNTRAFIGAGTGLGQAIAVFNGVDYEIISSEGGHVDFAPGNDFQVALYQFLNQKYPHVSYERLLSGEGLFNIYQFFSQICQADEQSIIEKEKILSQADKAKTIAQMAKVNPDGPAARSMELFFRIYGAQCGNLALNCLPSNGLFIAGGIAQKNLEYLKKSPFLSSFTAKGRMQQLMTCIPVKVITNADAGLSGATCVAAKQLGKPFTKQRTPTSNA